ncbi:MAG: flgE [Rhodospirillales bacterium]|nr:flgE [Rhodospirillales bacterium]
MSLFASLTTAVGGLNAQSAAIGNISDNVANAQTVGFKRIDTGFESLVTSSNANFNQPGGVLAQPVYENALSGSLVTAASSSDLAISGQGFFQVKAPPSTTAGTTTGSQFSGSNFYTRRGDFTINNQGYLVNGAGYYLEGYNVNPQTNVVNNANGSAVPIQVTQLLDNPVSTTTVNLAANLPSSSVSDLTAGYTTPAPVSVQVYDSFGNTHQASIQFNKLDPTQTSPVGNTNSWSAAITLAGSTSPVTTLQLTFGDGSAASTAAGTLASIADITSPANTAANAATIGPTTAGSASTVSIPYTIGAATQKISFNFGTYGTDTGVTQFADTQVNVSSITQNGIARGSFQNLSIDNNGNVALNYSNGQSLTYFQIPIAQFNAPDQLQRLNGSAFSSTQTSGAAQLSSPNADGAGSISSSTLEQSNVDIASEFTKLITAQNVYSANSKVITADNQLLQTVINLVQ